MTDVSRRRRRRPTRADWARIRLFAMDVDGVLTNGTVRIASNAGESKDFSILDGMGLRLLITSGIQVAWISGRPSGATAARAKELRIPHLIEGRVDKLEALQELAGRLGLDAVQCVYMGDDDIDSPAIRWAGIGASVPDAMPGARAAASLVSRRAGGHGAVREICEHILAARGRRKTR